MSGWDALSEDALEKLSTWPAKSRALFNELVEDAPSEMQRELLQRAVAAGHSPAEIHAFADELRVLEDDEAFEACTLDAHAPEGFSVVQRLRAEADPLYAYELKGHCLSPADERQEPLPAVARASGLRSTFDTGPEPSAAKGRALGPERVNFNELGQSVDATPRARPVAGPAPKASAVLVGHKLMEDLLNESARGLGVTYREQDVDDALLSLEAALSSAATAVGRGIPVPIALGPALVQHRRLAVMLQTSTSNGKRAWQIYDPFSGELYWVSEGDLLARTELPFSIKTNRRITRIALPAVSASAL